MDGRRIRLVRGPLRNRAGESGFTLVETLVSMSIAVVLLVPTVALITTAQNHVNGDALRATTIQYATAAMRQMDQELRQAYEIEYPTSTNNSSPNCPEGTTGSAAGVQTCNVIDVLARLTSTGLHAGATSRSATTARSRARRSPAITRAGATCAQRRPRPARPRRAPRRAPRCSRASS